MITIWIGYDSQFQKNTNIQLESIRKHTNGKFDVKYLHLNKLKNVLWRSRDLHQTTDSAFTRWLIPYLSDYQGWHLYMDSDMMVRKNLLGILKYQDPTKAVAVVKHSDIHNTSTKFNDKIQTVYDKKNWSSLMMFNAPLCKTLTLDYINTVSGLDLHQFKWTTEDKIGSIDAEWNYLVGVNKTQKDPAIVHWTLGGPWFLDYEDVEFSKEWHEYNS
jgi:lipopolysaccharide biosynthesis glycosyltransferase